ncbi:ribonuclease H-like domain-containing protein [Tanacetum coccineum]|uniref:Ribonuclease H-like domain-containing protein n=1 Tax=Tanacetum coccineum TaxID=301880 RepID=A0ABQ4YQC7_9ASTR
MRRIAISRSVDKMRKERDQKEQGSKVTGGDVACGRECGVWWRGCGIRWGRVLVARRLRRVRCGRIRGWGLRGFSRVGEYKSLLTDPIPDVKGAFATLSIDESDRSTQSHNVSKSGNGNSAFVARTNNRNNNWSGSNNQPGKLNRPNLICTHCNMNGHTADRCFELIGYSPNFKNNISINRGSTGNNDVSGIKDQSAGSSNSFTDDQYKRLMALISEKSSSSSMPANIVGPKWGLCIWHNRLGHPSDQVLDILKHKLNFETNSKKDLCEVCHKAKQTRKPFPISNHQTKDLGQLVYLDVWGPYKV